MNSKYILFLSVRCIFVVHFLKEGLGMVAKLEQNRCGCATWNPHSKTRNRLERSSTSCR